MNAPSFESLPPPPWSIAGTTVWLEKDSAKRELRILVPEGCMSTLNDDQVLELVEFVEVTREKFERALTPLGWKVCA